MADPVLRQDLAERDCLLGCVAAVRVDQQRDIVPECTADLPHDRLGAAGPLVLPTPALRAHAELEGVVAVALP